MSKRTKFKAEAKHWDEMTKLMLPFTNPFDLHKRKRSPFLAFWASPKVENVLRGNTLRHLFTNLVKPGGYSLEIGCGCGWLSLELARRGMNAIGIDIAHQSILLAKKYSNTQNTHIEYILSEASHLPLYTEKIDLIVVWDAMHHIPDVDVALRRSREVLKDDGKFFALDHVGGVKSPLFNKLILPWRFFSKVLRKKTCIARAHILKSIPTNQETFEDVSAKKWLKIVKKLFHVKKEVHLIVLANLMITPLLPLMPEEDPLLTFMAATTKVIDHILLKLFPEFSEYVWITATK